MWDLVYGPYQVTSYDFYPEQVTAVMMVASLTREEVWPLLVITKTGLEKGLRRLNRKDLLDLALLTGTIKVSEKVEFKKNNP